MQISGILGLNQLTGYRTAPVSVRTVLALAAILPNIAGGASVNLPAGTLATSYADLAGTQNVNESFSASFDLNNVSGLVPGEPIEVSFIYAEAMIWLGSIDAGIDPVTLHWAATFDLTVGIFSNSITETASLGPGSIPGGGGGYSTLSGPTPLSLVVPWGTDLSNVTLTLTDQSRVTGSGGRFLNSRLNSMSGILSTSSIPEPASALLALSGLVLLFGGRRHR